MRNSVDTANVVVKHIATILGLLAILVASGLALADKACQFHGSWFGHLDAPLDIDWLSTAHSINNQQGTYAIDFPGLDPTLFGLFPNGARFSTFRGTWERRDNHSVAITVIGYSLDSQGKTAGILKISAVNTFSEDCNTMSITNTNEVYLPGQNPFEDVPFYWGPGAPHSGYRMRVDPQYNP